MTIAVPIRPANTAPTHTVVSTVECDAITDLEVLLLYRFSDHDSPQLRGVASLHALDAAPDARLVLLCIVVDAVIARLAGV